MKRVVVAKYRRKRARWGRMGDRCALFWGAGSVNSKEGQMVRVQTEPQFASAHSLAFPNNSFLSKNLNSNPRNYIQIYKERAMSCPASSGLHSASRKVKNRSKSSRTGWQIANAVRCILGMGLESLARKQGKVSGDSGCEKRVGLERKLVAFSRTKIGRPYSLKFQSNFLKVAVCSARKYFQKLISHFCSHFRPHPQKTARSSCAFSPSLVSPASSFSPFYSGFRVRLWP